MTNNIDITHNKTQMRFEANLNGEVAYMEYRFYKGDIAFMHTKVPQSYSGKGVGTQLAHAGLAYADAEKLKIMLYCPFVSKFVHDHPEFHHLVDTQYHPAYKKS